MIGLIQSWIRICIKWNWSETLVHIISLCSDVQVREVIKQAKNELAMMKRSTILFMDEVHRFNKAQQDSFLPHIESGTDLTKLNIECITTFILISTSIHARVLTYDNLTNSIRVI